MKRLTNHSGFSLIELMVVVAIIGILSAVAIPNFMTFQRKARQAEPKANLGAIYTTEKAYQAEWNTFTDSFSNLGYAPAGQLRYNTGFTVAALGTVKAANDAVPLGVPHTNAYCAANATLCTMVGTTTTALAGGAAAATTFNARSHGDLGGANATDIWDMNQLQQLTNPTSGL